MKYYDIVRAIREDNDLTQNDTAKILNTNQRRISRIETGTSEMTMTELKKYCEHFRISADYILQINFISDR